MVLSVLPGTALRAQATADGLVFEPAPPYQVISTPLIEPGRINALMRQMEVTLDRRLDEYPRPHLVGPENPPDPPDTMLFDVTRSPAELQKAAALPGASHMACWIEGRDLFARREIIHQILQTRMKTDPH